MLKNSMIVGVLMLALSSSADAALLGASTLMPESATKVAWVCGPFRCVWRPGWHGVVPAFAVWGPPRLLGCFYERRHHHWDEVCP
jgi:hypothetical protein